MAADALIHRAWAMPDSETFSIPVIGEFVRRYLAASSVSVDPFARNKRMAQWTNDLNPHTTAEYHMEARDFLAMLIRRGVKPDLVFFDPPYSPREISECYRAAGLTAGIRETQNARLYRDCRALITEMAAPGCVVLSFGWNSSGMGRGWHREEALIVCHGAAHNDTICVADRLLRQEAFA